MPWALGEMTNNMGATTHIGFFFFQAEDGIRDVAVTGVQTCALPISATATAPAALLFLFMVAPPGRSRWLVVLTAAWCLMRAPLGSALELASLFSPADRKSVV